MIPASDHGPLFLLAASLDGNLAQTAALSGVALEELTTLATASGWPARFATLRELRDQEGPDALARELNRMTNLTQAQRGRELLDRALGHFLAQDIDSLTTVSTEKASNHSAKVLVDLVKAIETVQQLTYRAIGDSLTERRQEGSLFGPGRLAALSRGQQAASAVTSALDGPAAPPEAPAAATHEPDPIPVSTPPALKPPPRRRRIPKDKLMRRDIQKKRALEGESQLLNALDKPAESPTTPQGEPKRHTLPQPPTV